MTSTTHLHDENDINSQNKPHTHRSTTSSSSSDQHSSPPSHAPTNSTTTTTHHHQRKKKSKTTATTSITSSSTSSPTPPQSTMNNDRQRQSSVESDASSVGGRSEEMMENDDDQKMSQSPSIKEEQAQAAVQSASRASRSSSSSPRGSSSTQSGHFLLHTPAAIISNGNGSVAEANGGGGGIHPSASAPSLSSSSYANGHVATTSATTGATWSSSRASLVHLAHFLQNQMNSVLSFLTIGQVLMCFPVCQDLNRACQRYLASMDSVDLSQFWGVIGSTQADSHFYNSFLPKCRNVRRICLSYCTQLKSSHLDRILSKLCESSSHVEESAHPEVNERITELNLYYCKKLGAQATFKIAARCPNLEVLNMGRCHLITSHENINGLRALSSLRNLRELSITLNTDLERNDVIEIVSLMIYDESFVSLKVLDLRVGCRLLTHSKDIDLDDLEERGVRILGLPGHAVERRGRP